MRYPGGLHPGLASVQPVKGRSLAVWIMAALSTAGCGGSQDEQLVVFAASSLTDVFDRIESEFEAAHADIDVVVNYAGSSALAGQIEQGAPADVFAAADLASMERVLAAAAGDPVVFAHNRLAIAVELGNPRAIAGLQDLTAADLIVVLADPAVPVGAYAADMLQEAGVELDPASYETNARAVASKVALGEADAGIVYRTDITAYPEQLESVEVPETLGVLADYPIVVIRDSDTADALLAFVLGAAGRQALLDAGFELP
jgi:molybdate transport system substrate-binding protein